MLENVYILVDFLGQYFWEILNHYHPKYIKYCIYDFGCINVYYMHKLIYRDFCEIFIGCWWERWFFLKKSTICTVRTNPHIFPVLEINFVIFAHPSLNFWILKDLQDYVQNCGYYVFVSSFLKP